MVAWTHLQQADDKIHEDPFLNFLVNIHTVAFNVEIDENAEIDPKEIFEVLVGTSTDRTSISSFCEDSADAPSGNDILHHLRTKFDLESVASTGNILLQQNVVETLPEQMEVFTDLHRGPTPELEGQKSL